MSEWKIGTVCTRDVIRDHNGHPELVATGVSPATAAQIVRDHNAHADLLAACEHAAMVVRAILNPDANDCGPDDIDPVSECATLDNILRAAIRKTKP